MKKIIALLVPVILLGSLFQSEAKDFYDLEFQTIEGENLSMEEYKGSPVLIVNTASECGLAPQLEGLQKIYEEYEELTVIGFPSNDFADQEPLEGMEIKEFCQNHYNVSFTLAEKIHVVGDDQHPIYEWLTSKELNGKKDSEIHWNFQKYLISEEGELSEMIDPRTTPDSEEMTTVLEENVKQ